MREFRIETKEYVIDWLRRELMLVKGCDEMTSILVFTPSPAYTARLKKLLSQMDMLAHATDPDHAVSFQDAGCFTIVKFQSAEDAMAFKLRWT